MHTNASAIHLEFPTNASYSLGLPLDDGTGTDYTSLILFDLSVLALTKLPALIHDSYLLANIRGSRLENLIKTYAAATDKQIFLAIDETEKLSEETASLVNREDIKAATLWHGGGELYGFYWSGKNGAGVVSLAGVGKRANLSEVNIVKLPSHKKTNSCYNAVRRRRLCTMLP